MKRVFWFFFFLVAFVFLTRSFYIALKNPLAPPSLKILTYSSFAGAYGPGNLLKEEFEKHCDCMVQWFLSEDSTLLAQRFYLLPKIDMVLGWDQITKLSSSSSNHLKTTNPSKTAEKAGSELWENLSLFGKNHIHPRFLKLFDSQATWFSDFFIPYNWSPIGFLTKDISQKKQTLQLEDLAKLPGRFSIPEPRTSNLGLQFYYWIYESYEGDLTKIENYLKQIKNKIHGPVPSWSLAYALFRKGQTHLGFSYLSSLLYHEKEEPDQKYFFLSFESAHPYQVELFSISKTAKNKALAFRFAKLLLSKKGQDILRNNNYMFALEDHLAIEREAPAQFLKYNLLDSFMNQKPELLDLWQKTLF